MLVFAAIAPHGGDIVSQIADDPRVMEKTREAMRELGRRCADARPETVVVLTPHGIRLPGYVALGKTQYAAGELASQTDPARRIKAAFTTDLDLAGRIEAEADAQRIPLRNLVGEKNGRGAVLPLDWGALIPLWFLAHPLTPRPEVVVLTPDGGLPREMLVRLGVAIARAADSSGKRVALIASGDQAHAHDADGPYGFDPAAAAHDEAMCAALAADDLEQLLYWPPEFLEDAKIDAFYQTLILMGALGHTPMRGELLSYEAPTYFGMAVAAYAPDGELRSADGGEEIGVV